MFLFFYSNVPKPKIRNLNKQKYQIIANFMTNSGLSCHVTPTGALIFINPIIALLNSHVSTDKLQILVEKARILCPESRVINQLKQQLQYEAVS